MGVSVITNGPVTGTTARGTTNPLHLSCRQLPKTVPYVQLQNNPKPRLYVQILAKESDLQSTNFTCKDTGVEEVRETVRKAKVIVEDQQESREDNESDGELIIDDSSCDTSSTSEEGNSSKQDGQTVESKVPRNVARTESHQKMEDAKNWLQSVMVISSTLSLVSLRSIEDAYKAYCHEKGQEPLSTPVLARLIHGLFQDAENCRVGPRGNQKIHYRKLAFKDDCKLNLSSSSEDDNQKEKIQNEEDISSQEKEVNEEEPLNLSQKPRETREKKEKYKKQQENLLTTESCPKEIQEQLVTTSDTAAQNSEQKQISEDDKEGCENAAKRLSQVLKWINNQGRKDVLLKDFAHSASCKKESCSHLCMMFRRVRRHVVGARHACMVLKLYSVLLRLHVSSCNDLDCGLPACPALRAARPGKRTIESEESSPKRAARRISSGFISSRAVFEPRSPGGSLPGSPVNSPVLSPETPFFEQGVPLNTGSVQYMIVPVLPVVMSPSGKRVA